MIRARRIAFTLALAAALPLGVAAPAPAHAQTATSEPSAADKESARALMEEGDKAYAAKEYPAALKAYSAAHALVNLPSTGIWVAKAHVALGQMIEARDMALKIGTLPKKPAEHPASVKARAEAAQMVDALARRIGTLQVVVEGVEGASPAVSVDGASVPAEAASAPRKVNPGKHVVSASAAGYSSASSEVIVAEGETKSLTIKLTRTATTGEAPPPAAAPAPASSPATTETRETPSAPPPAGDSSGGTSPLVYVGFILGGVGAAVGVVAGSASFATVGAAEENCDGDKCTKEAQGDINTTKALSWASNVGFAVGAVGVTIGLVALITNSRGGTKSTGTRLLSTCGSGAPRGAPVTWCGRF